MKRGRPKRRNEIQREIVSILSVGTPMNTAIITKQISKTLNENVSWHTVNKYLNELVQLDKLRVTVLPHSKDEKKQGLIVYSLKK